MSEVALCSKESDRGRVPLPRSGSACPRRRPFARRAEPRFLFAVALSLAACAGGGPARGTIGALLARDSEGALRVLETPALLGAAEGGLRPGDRILLIEGRDPRGLSEPELRALLAGEVGAPIRLTVERGAEVHRLTLRRTLPPPRRQPEANPR